MKSKVNNIKETAQVVSHLI